MENAKGTSIRAWAERTNFSIAEREPLFVWRCYDCGVTSESSSFSTVYYPMGDYDCRCDACGGLNTHEDRDGTPQCEDCGRIDWYCADCEKAKCIECWSWFQVEEEPLDPICPNCLTPYCSAEPT